MCQQLLHHRFKIRLLAVAGVVLDEAGGALGIQQGGNGGARGGFGGGQRVEGGPGVAREGFDRPRIPGGPGRNLGNERLRELQRRGRNGGEQCIEGLLLHGRGHHCGGSLAVVFQGVGEVLPANGFGHGFNLVALEQVDGHQHFLQRGQGRILADGFFRESVEHVPPHGHQLCELRHGVGALVPLVGGRVHVAADVGNEAKPLLQGFLHNLVEGGVLVGAFGKVGVAPQNGALVPGANAGGVGIRQVDAAIGQ